MNSNFLNFSEIEVRKAETDHDFALINNFRNSFGSVDIDMETHFQQREIIRDQSSIVLIFSRNDEIIASLRHTPMGKDISTVESVFPEVNKQHFHLSTWESSRFVIQPEFRGKGIFRYCVKISMEWLRDQTLCQNIVAPIKKGLLPLYEKFGFYSIFSTQLLLNNRLTNYEIIMADLMTILSRSQIADSQKSIPVWKDFYHAEPSGNNINSY